MAKKTAISAAEALRQFKRYSSSNTKVVIDDKGNASMYLFGNRIAYHAKDGNRLFITTCGWNTVTTRGRLNEIVASSIRTRSGRLSIAGKDWDGRWIEIVDAPPVIMIEHNEPPI